MKERFQKYHKYQTYGDLIKKFIPYFKLYSTYILNAEKGQILMNDYKDSN
jgi:hypothetical protein